MELAPPVLAVVVFALYFAYCQSPRAEERLRRTYARRYLPWPVRVPYGVLFLAPGIVALAAPPVSTLFSFLRLLALFLSLGTSTLVAFRRQEWAMPRWMRAELRSGEVPRQVPGPSDRPTYLLGVVLGFGGALLWTVGMFTGLFGVQL